MKRTVVVLLAVMFVLAGMSFAIAQQSSQKAGAASSQVSNDDKKFVQEAYSDNLFEIQAGKLAQEKASSAQVKDYGKMLQNEHTKASQQLQQIAKNKGIEVSQEMSKDNQEKLDKLSKLSGQDFDKEFLSMQEKDHKKDVEAFQKEAKDGKDPEIKNFASTMVPGLQHHYAMAQDLSRGTAKAEPTGRPTSAQR